MSSNDRLAPPEDSPVPVVLFVENDVMVRAAIAGYIRECGYEVIEAASTDEALILLNRQDLAIDMVFADVETPGQVDGFGLSRWLREQRPSVHVILAGTIQKAAQLAGDLCEQGPHLRKPYEPSTLVDWVKRLRAKK